MPPVKTRALILHSFAFGDTSRILRLLTPSYGLRSVIAKGAQRPRSRFGGILEPFTEGEAAFILREGRDLLTLSEFSLIRSRQGIGRDLTAFAGASLVAEIALRAATEEPLELLFDTLVTTFDTLAAEPKDPAATALSAAWYIITILGFQPEMETCVRCGRHLAPEEPARFDVEAGGVACRACRPAGRLLDAITRREVAAMASRPTTDLELPSRRLHAAVLHIFLSTHLAPDRPLRSLPLFLEHIR
ncbi:MAG: DNA repair protein RecO [Gemmatimonadota bacterium]